MRTRSSAELKNSCFTNVLIPVHSQHGIHTDTADICIYKGQASLSMYYKMSLRFHLAANPLIYICKHTTPTSKHYIPVHSQHGNSTRKIANKCFGKKKFLPMSYPWDAYTELKGRATNHNLFSISCCTHSLMGCINGLNTSHCITHSCSFPQWNAHKKHTRAHHTQTWNSILKKSKSSK